MKTVLTFFMLVLFVNNCLSQTSRDEYLSIAGKADSLFTLKKYQSAADLYQKAFVTNNGLGKVIHRYKAASCYTLLNKPDSAFIELDRIATKGKFSKYDMITSDSAFNPLHSDRRWGILIERIKENSTIPDN